MKRICFYLIGTLFLFAACMNNGQMNSANGNDSDSVVAEVVETKVLSAEAIYNKSIDKIAMVLCYKDGIPYSQGSGFFIDKNLLVTNFHCVAGSDRVEFKMAGQDEIYKGAKVVKSSEIYDLAIIQTQQEFPYLNIDSLNNEVVGAKVYAIGNPKGLEGTITDGIISGKRDFDDIELLQVTAPINPGNSGGPVLDESGKVIGVATFTYKDSQNLNFAVPVKYIAACEPYDPQSPARPKKIEVKTDDITMTNFQKDGSEFYEYLTLKNNTNENITSVHIVLVYRTMDGEILDYQEISEDVYIPVGLAKRIQIRSFDNSQSWKYYKSEGYFYKNFKVEFRLLSYEVEP
jgi:hypothetical protein